MSTEISHSNLAANRQPVVDLVRPKLSPQQPKAAQESTAKPQTRLHLLPTEPSLLEQQTAKPTSNQELTELVSNLNDFAQSVRRELQFYLDDDSGEVVIKVIDSSTDEVIRQIPSDEVLSVRQQLRETKLALFSAEA